jgi:glycosyltransferase involved in cell wall biosynthesis
MKIIQLVMARQFRGAEMFAAQLSRDLAKGGIDVRYIALYKNNETEFVPEGLDFIDLNETRGALNWSLIKKLRDVVREFNPDIIQANAGDTLKYAVLVKTLFNLRYKIVFRNASVVSHYIRTYPQKLFNAFLYRLVDRVLSVSELSKNDLLSLYPFCADKIEVIPNGITLNTVNKVHTFSEKQFNIVHVGGFTFEKNHEGLIRIFQQVHKTSENAKLWLIGEGPLKNRIHQIVADASLEKSIVFTGAVRNAADYIYSADALVLPSITEGLPGVLLEAFYCKTPVVAYDTGGIGEVVKNGKTGILIDKGNESAFVSAISSLVNPHQSPVFLENAYRLVIDNFDNEIINRKFLNAYRHLLGIV